MNPLGWLIASSDLVAVFPVCCVFRNDRELLLFVTALLAVLIRSEAESVSFLMGLGERGSYQDPCHNLFTLTCESEALVWGSCPKSEGGRFSGVISHLSRGDTAA